MKLKDKEINIDEAIKEADIDNVILVRRSNGLLLSNYQVNVLKRNGLDYLKYGNIHDLLFDIEECLYDNYDDELDLVSSQLAEFVYYNETKK